MCEYCDESIEVLERNCSLVYKNDMYETGRRRVDVPSNFCSNCGAPLGGVKPLTMEQLRQMDGKPVYLIILNNENVNELYKGFSGVVFFIGDGFAKLSSKENLFIPIDEHYGINLFAFNQYYKGEF